MQLEMKYFYSHQHIPKIIKEEISDLDYLFLEDNNVEVEIYNYFWEPPYLLVIRDKSNKVDYITSIITYEKNYKEQLASILKISILRLRVLWNMSQLSFNF